MTEQFHYAGSGVDTQAWDLPGLKANFIVGHVDDDVTLLDVGCGGGKMLRTIKDHRQNVVLLGCDVTRPDVVDDFEFAFVDAVTGRLPYDDESIDVALVFDVLEHVDQPDTMLREINRVLRPDGRLLAFVPIEGERVSWYRLFRLILGDDLYVKTKGHVQSFTHHGLADMLRKEFVIEEIRYAYHPIGQLMDAALCAALSIGGVQRAFWTHSPYHGNDETARSSGLVGKFVAAALRAANAVAWVESTLLRNLRRGSAGVLLVAHPRA